MSIDLVERTMQLFKKVEGEIEDKFIASEALFKKLVNRKLFFFVSLRDFGDGIKFITP